ncbi:MAG TPA: hypothetical protein PKZ78_10370, partial [Candidatus Goldiibacteriota bacterium]|nr:hypothetical protein [Candidatus Goldiibacteriota bacterium]
MKILVYASKEKGEYLKKLVSSGNADFIFIEKKESALVPADTIPYFDLALISVSFDFDTSFSLI